HHFFYCYTNPRDLHSFPTRRSSDLLATASVRTDGSSRFGPNNRYGTFPAVSLGWVITQEPMLSGLSRLGQIKLRGSIGTTGNQRSEEHTSELQSRSDLVCRLLLEKK